jgi:hypothetical protein
MSTGLVVAAMLGFDPNSGVNLKLDRVNESSIAYVTVYAKCFENAWVSNLGSRPARDEAMRQCMTMRPALIDKYGASRTGDRLQAKRNLERSLDAIEHAYAEASAKQSS